MMVRCGEHEEIDSWKSIHVTFLSQGRLTTAGSLIVIVSANSFSAEYTWQYWAWGTLLKSQMVLWMDTTSWSMFGDRLTWHIVVSDWLSSNNWDRQDDFDIGIEIGVRWHWTTGENVHCLISDSSSHIINLWFIELIPMIFGRLEYAYLSPLKIVGRGIK